MKGTSRTTHGGKTHTAPKRAAKSTRMTADTNPAGRAGISSDERHRMTAEAAYFRAQARAFSGGNPEQDWYEAESEIDSALLQHSRDE